MGQKRVRRRSEIWLAVAAFTTAMLPISVDVTLAQEMSFAGMCDASAAEALDATHFVVADDERDTLRVFELGDPIGVASLNLTDYLGNRNTSGVPKEGDIEGAARVGDSIFWITSHGRNKDGEVKQFRWRFFETPVDTSGPVPTVTIPSAPPYKALHQDLLDYDAQRNLGLKAADGLPPKQGGLNIEGLAWDGGTGVFIGFRSPLVGADQKALVIRMIDVSKTVLGNGTSDDLGPPILLNWGGRGIRSMERVGDHFLIVAGPARENSFSPVTPAFALFTWKGEGAAPELTNTDFGGLSPEALFEIGLAGQLVALSDDGTVQVHGADCKDAPQSEKSFRAMIIKP